MTYGGEPTNLPFNSNTLPAGDDPITDMPPVRQKSNDNDDCRIGDVVLVQSGLGIVRFIGDVEFAVGRHLGIELKGKRVSHGSDGMVEGKRYFTCDMGSAVFVKDVKRLIKPEELLEKVAELNDAYLLCTCKYQ